MSIPVWLCCIRGSGEKGPGMETPLQLPPCRQDNLERLPPPPKGILSTAFRYSKANTYSFTFEFIHRLLDKGLDSVSRMMFIAVALQCLLGSGVAEGGQGWPPLVSWGWSKSSLTTNISSCLLFVEKFYQEGDCYLFFLPATPLPWSRILEKVYELSQLPSRALNTAS